jgi:hypothetical protein
MNKYASQFNELIVLAREEKTKKKGGSIASVLKLVQDLAEFEGNIQEAIDAQEMAENRTKIEAFLNDIDGMYEVLLDMAKATIQSMRSERNQPILEEGVEGMEMDAEPAPATREPKDDTKISIDNLRKQLDSKPTAPVQLTVPQAPR